MYKQLELRPHVSTTRAIHALLARAHCWHFDAWLYRDPHKRLYLAVETRKGGRIPLQRHIYQVLDSSRLHYVPALPAGAREITLQDRAEALNYPELNVLHWRYVVPMLARRPLAYRSQSVALHYCRAPSLDPMEGAGPNFHVYARGAGA